MFREVLEIDEQDDNYDDDDPEPEDEKGGEEKKEHFQIPSPFPSFFSSDFPSTIPITDSILSLRKHFENRARGMIEEAKRIIRMADSSLSTLHLSSTNAQFISTQRVRYEESKKVQNVEISRLEQEIFQIQRGVFDSQYKQEQEQFQKKIDDKKQAKREFKAKEQVRRQHAWEQERKMSHNVSEHSMDNALRYFYRVSDEMPAWLSDKLKNMPANMGYIHRGVFFYGLQPPKLNPRTGQEEPTVLFETCPKGARKIHEWTPNEYKIYWKKSKDDKKEEIFKASRRKIPNKFVI